MNTNKTRTKDFLTVLFRAIRKDQIPVRSAALAYYALFAFAPLVLIVVVISNTLLDAPQVQGVIFSILTEQVGPHVSPILEKIQVHGTNLSLNVVSGTIGLLVALYGAVNFVVYLRKSFIHIFGFSVPSSTEGNLSFVVKTYARSFVYLFVLLVPVIGALLVNSALSFLLPIFSEPFRVLFSGTYTSVYLGALASLPFALFFFTFLYRIVSGGTISWKRAFLGALVSSMLLLVLNTALEVYFIFSTTLSVYGAAGSVIALLLWLYYAIQVMLIGAEAAKLSRV